MDAIIPKSMINQAILQKMIQHADDTSATYSLEPSLERFLGALLLIDISGFTNLSTLLSSEEMIRHINEYFDLMIDIVNKAGGDIVKFAGDSLFVVWRKPADTNADVIAGVIEVSISCALEVTEVCDNYEVRYSAPTDDKRYRTPSGIASLALEWDGMEAEREQVFVLSVHSALSFGVMGGVDIGEGGRWEYFILGNTISEVSKGLSKADRGKVVVSAVAYDYVAAAFDSRSDMFTYLGDGIYEVNPTAWLTRIMKSNEVVLSEVLLDSSNALDKYIILNIMGFQRLPGKSLKTDADVEKEVMNFLVDMTICHAHESVRLSDGTCMSVPQTSSGKRKVTEKSSSDLKQSQVDSFDDFVEPYFAPAELRTVVVLFIKLDIEPELLFEETASRTLKCFQGTVADMYREELAFVKRSENEAAADRSLLRRLQMCISTVNVALSTEKGQLRQFIYDDKGVICIGSFGLKKSVVEDNVKAAIIAACQIRKQFIELGIVTHIGITSGRPFCGYVGSPARCEYAMLGRSVNLSARLMASAGANQILCDSTIQNELACIFSFDRTLAPLKAKGYSEPVRVYQLNIEESSQAPRISSMTVPATDETDYDYEFDDTADSESVISSRQVSMTSVTSDLFIGRDKELLLALDFFINDNEDEQCPKVLCISGSRGYGKSSMLKRVMSSLEVHSASSSWAMFLCYSRQSEALQSFSLWGYIFRRIFRMIARYIASRSYVESRVEDFEATVMSDTAVTEYLISRLPATQQADLSVLSGVLLDFQEPESASVSRLEGQAVMSKTAELLLLILRICIQELDKKQLMIFIDDVEYTDSASWDLLKRCIDLGLLSYIAVSYDASLAASSIFFRDMTNMEERSRVVILKLDLKPLASEDTLNYTTALLSRLDQTGNQTAGSRELNELLLVASGGNPMLLRKLIGLSRRLKLQQLPSLQAKMEAIQELIASHSSSIEAFVMNRFDAFPLFFQVLLKVASVISFHGELISPRLVFRVLKANMVCDGEKIKEGERSVSGRMKLAKPFGGSATLLRVACGLTKLSQGSPALRFFTSDGAQSFAFASGVEQVAIYGLMLETEKSMYHHTVAVYFEEAAAKSKALDLSPVELFSIADHYERARMHSKAMKYYYKAAVQLDLKGQVTESKAMISAAKAMHQLKKAGSTGVNADANVELFQRSLGRFLSGPFAGMKSRGSKEWLRTDSSEQLPELSGEQKNVPTVVAGVGGEGGGDGDDLTMRDHVANYDTGTNSDIAHNDLSDAEKAMTGRGAEPLSGQLQSNRSTVVGGEPVGCCCVA